MTQESGSINDNDLTDPVSTFRLNNPQSIIMAHLNVNSVRLKFKEILPWMSNDLIHVLSLTETKLDESTKDAVFTKDLSNYTLYRNDRNAHGGSIMCMVKSCIPQTARPDISYNEHGIESLVVELRVKSNKWSYFTYQNLPTCTLIYT